MPGDATTPADLADLISSIAVVGVLEPILVEELPDPAGGPAHMKVAAGERRVRAVRWGASHQPTNVHFGHIPAITCPGPLSEEERRIWQLVENLARQPLRPTELAMALLLHRCAVLLGKLVAAGKSVPAEVYSLDDPVARFEALERLRGSDGSCAAPWTEVLRRLGLQLTSRDARQLVQAFRELPRHLAEEMDEAKIRLHTRLRFVALRKDRAAAADEIWAAVKARGRPQLLAGAITAADAVPSNHTIDADAVLTTAELARDQSYATRAARLRQVLRGDTADGLSVPVDPDDAPAGHGVAVAGSPSIGSPLAAAAARDRDSTSTCSIEEPVDPQIVTAALVGLRELVAALAQGHCLDLYDHESLRLLWEQVHPTVRAA